MAAIRSSDDDARLVVSVITGLLDELRPHGHPTVTLDSDLERDLALDSLALAELLARLDDARGTRMSTTLLGTATTPRDLLVDPTSAASPPTVVPPSSATAPSTPAPVRQPGAVGPRPTDLPTLLDSLDWHLATHPDRPHLRLLDETAPVELTYAELHDQALAVAHGLRRRGAETGDSIALMLPTGRDYFVAFLGVLLAGCTAVPIYPPDRPSRIGEHLQRQRHILDNARATVLITVPEGRSLARLMRTHVASLRHVCTAEELAPTDGDPMPLPRAGPDDVALVQYTSGSTGAPKGVVLSHRDLVVNIDAMAQVIRATPEDVFVSWLPLYHDMGLIGAWLGSLHVGMRLVSMPPQDFLVRPAAWLQAITDHGGTLAASPNFGYELCLRRVTDEQMDGLDLSTWRLAFNGAEAVGPDTLRRFADRFGPVGLRPEALAPVYGLAEAAVGLAFPPVGRPPIIDRISRDRLVRGGVAEPVPDGATGPDVLELAACGQPLPGYAIRVVDRAGSTLPDRAQGRIQFTGPSATRGYLRNDEATRRLRDGEWLDTGDLGYLADGDIVITGRVKDLIIRAGRNLHPQELEQVIGAVDGVRAGCVAAFGVGDVERGTERLVVVAETRETDPVAREAIQSGIVDAAVDVVETPPDEIVLVGPGTVPKTSSGKLRRAETARRYTDGLLDQPVRAAWVQLARFGWDGLPKAVRGLIGRFRETLHAAWARVLVVSVVVPLAVLVVLLPGHRLRWRLVRRVLRALVPLMGTPIEADGAALPAPPAVIVANHASWLDGLVLSAHLEGGVRFVVGEVLRDKPIEGFVLRRLGAVFVERHDREQGVADVAALSETLDGRSYLVAFPEGGLDSTVGLRPFRLGAFSVAATAGVPVVPIAIRGSRWVLPPHTTHLRRGTIHLEVGAPILPAGSGWSATLQLRDAARAHIALHCGETDLG